MDDPMDSPATASLHHQSDLFPSVPKSPSVKKETVNEEDSQIQAFANASTFNQDSNYDGKKKTIATAAVGIGVGPGQRLEFPSSIKPP